MPERFELATIDLLVVGGYIVGILTLGFLVGRGRVNADDYFLAGRGSTWPLIGFGLMSANLSGTSFIGLAGAGYHDGIAVWSYEWMATVVLVLFALVVLPIYLRARVSTLPEFLERRYDRRSRYALSAFSVLTAMAIDAAGALYAGAVVLQLVFPQAPLLSLVAVIGVLAGGYVTLGGLRAVLITDTVQGVLLLTAGGVLFTVGMLELGSWEALKNAAPPGGFHLIKPADDPFLPGPGLATGVLWLGIYYWSANHIVVQKVLSARDLNHARWGALFCALLQLPMLVLLILPGTMGRVILPGLDDPDMVWPALALDFLPIGLRGLVLAALVAALMSTLDSVLNGAASMVTNDFVRQLGRELSDRALLRAGRISVLVLMILAILWAPQIARFPTIVQYFQSFLGHITMPVVAVFLGGLFWQRASATAAFWTLVIGIPVGGAAFVASELLHLVRIQFLYATGMMLLFSTALLVSLSLLSPSKGPAPELLWSRHAWREETSRLSSLPGWKNPRVLGGALLLLTAVLVWTFR